MTTNNTHNRQTSVPPAAFEPAIPASERPQTYASDRVATGITTVAQSSKFNSDFGVLRTVNIKGLWDVKLCTLRRNLQTVFI